MIDEPLRDRWIDLVLARADELRDKGVLSIGVDGCTATFAPKELTPQPVGEIAKPDSSVGPGLVPNPLEDPASYPFGIVPGFVIKQLEDFEE